MKISIKDILENEFKDKYEIVDNRMVIIKNSKGYPLLTEAQRFADIIQRRYGRDDTFDLIEDVFFSECAFRFNIDIKDKCIESE